MVDGMAKKTRGATLDLILALRRISALGTILALGSIFALGLILALGAFFWAPDARAEDARAATICEASSENFTAPAPLPHVVAALKISDKLPILIIGSPVGLDKSQRKSYPAALEQILEQKLTGVDAVISNRPVSGEVVATAIERMRTEVALARPALVIWQVGANDALQNVDPRQYEADLTEGLRWLKNNGVDVLLVGFEANPWLHNQDEAAAIRAATQEVALSENVLYLRRYEAMQFLARTKKSVEAGDNPFSPELGLDCLAEQVAQALVANLVLRRTRPLEP